jgi:Ca2+/Na+ antiporter
MQIVLVGLALLLALAPAAMIKSLSAGDSRSIRIVRRGLFTVAVFCGGAAMGCWLLTQADAAITPQEGPRTVATLLGSSLAFLTTLAGSSFLGHRKQGIRAVLRSTVFLVGTCGLCVLVFFVVTSRGLIFKFGALPFFVLLVSLACVALFWRTDPSSREDTSTAFPGGDSERP